MSEYFKTWLDPRLWPEGSFGLGFVLMSFRQFSWKWLVGFSWNFWIFFEKFPSDKNGQKWLLKKVFRRSSKIKSLVLPGNGVKWKYLWSFNIMQKASCLWKIWFSIHRQKCSRQLFLNRQYFVNGLISDFYFLNADRHEWKEKGFLMSFMEKNRSK